ncbi:MAG: putative bifunctional diguanylate cyclase/phosphodiesterase [Hyphomicrobiales bacterium]
MLKVLNCITNDHNPWLVILALLICTAGSLVAIRLYLRADITRGLQRTGWIFLAAVAGGTAVWCTHFVALIGYETILRPEYEPMLTMLSLMVAIIGMSICFSISFLRFPAAPEVGGAGVGLSAAAMHYVGMEAYRMNGMILWEPGYIAASLLFAAAFGALSLSRAMRPATRWCKYGGAASLTLAIVLLHFTGMAGITVIPLSFEDVAPPSEHLASAMALIVAGACLLVVGTGLASWVIDNSSRADSIETMRKLALSDGLTNLPNRLALSERLEVELERRRIRKQNVALVAIDIDGFKELNETHGHRAGDEVLVTMAQRLESCVEPGEFISRVGSDDFCVIKRYDRDAELVAFTNRLEEAVRKPVETERFNGTISVSMGVSLCPNDTSSREQLLGNAELALQRAKKDASRILCFYEGEMDNAQRARRKLAADLRVALDAGQFELHYQPQVGTHDGKLRGFEALMRWRHPERGMVPPSDFIPIAEESGLILLMGQWALRTACAEAASWDGDYRVAVNLSPVQFSDTRLPETVHQVLLDTGLPARRLQLEITESTIMNDAAQALHLLRRIKAMGVSIAMDDFGTGNSSLSTLRLFPFDKIKLDRSFINDFGRCPQAKAVIRAVLALGRSLGISILAEGVETPAQLAFLRKEGCDAVQGYLTGRPMPAGQLFAARAPSKDGTSAEPRALLA